MIYAKLLIVLCFAFLYFSFLAFAGYKTLVPYPEGYRQWVHVKSAIIGPESPAHKNYGGIHHIYANEKALEGYRTGAFADGSAIVFDLLEVQANENGTTTEGPRRRVDVMHKDSRKFRATSGWGYEGFRAGNRTDRVLEDGGAKCFACHMSQRKRDYVFSSYRE